MVSGQYPARVNNDVYVVQHLNRFGGGGIKKSEARFRGPEQTEDVAAEAITIAEALKENGYATAHIGKYHVGGHEGDATLPENVGFDINLGGFSQGHQPSCFAADKKGEWHFRGVGRGDFDKYATPYSEAYTQRRGLPSSLIGTPKHISDALGDAVEETIADLSSTGKPFYLQFHSYAVHGPVRARPDLRLAAQQRVGDGQGKKMIEYLAFIAGMDENVGRILTALEDPNGDGETSDSIVANTLLLFTSDNGGTHADNQPLRGKKGMFTEGGIRVPLIAYWQGVIPANTVTRRMVHSVDYYPTCLELAGSEWMPPQGSHPLDGESFADILWQPSLQTARGAIYYLFPGYMDTRAEPCAVIIDQWHGKRYKLLYFYEADSWELYCLSDDRGEVNNLIEAEPKVASILSQKINAWLTQDHSTWQPKYPLDASSGRPVGPPPVL
jgi:arylsulfatase A-like enzyme